VVPSLVSVVVAGSGFVSVVEGWVSEGVVVVVDAGASLASVKVPVVSRVG